MSDRYETEQPVMLIDRLAILPGQQARVHALMTTRYAGHVAARGLRLSGAWLSPPFERTGHGSELTVVWEYASLGALWGARMQEEDDPVARGIWAELATLTSARSRTVARSAPMDLPPLDESGRVPIASEERLRTILFVRPLDPVAADAEADWIRAAEAVAGEGGGVSTSRAGFHQQYSFMPGHFTWDLSGAAALDMAALLAALPGPAEIVDGVTLGVPLSQGVRRPGLAGTKRTILVRAKTGPGTPDLGAFEQALSDTPGYVTAIDNWRVSRVASSLGHVAWTHCFEQEVTDAGVFVGDYLNHPFHWAVVERLFHPDAPERVGDAFCHTLYPVTSSVLGAVIGGQSA